MHSETLNLSLLILVATLGIEPALCGMVRLVSTCTTKTGIGRCTIEASSCQDLGGAVQNEMRMSDGSKALNSCADDEVCCVLPSIPTTETCNICGKKGTERQIRRSNLERRLEASSPNKLRVLRQAGPDLDARNIPLRMGRILNGNNAEKNEWCWQVALLNSDGTVLGSGSLVDGRYVVTAAHKVAGKNSSNLVILIGQYDFSVPVNEENNSTIWYAKPVEIVIHERYNPQTLENNIALIRIPMISCDAANVCPVCLNDISDQKEYMASLSNCYITGWGASVQRDASPVLQEARVRILSPDECVQRFVALGLADVQLPVSAFCAEGIRDWSIASELTGPAPIISTCSGDGGGPLVCEGFDGRWRLMGMIAMGLDDCKQTRISAPTVFVNVGVYVEWIRDILNRRPSVGNLADLAAAVQASGQQDTTNQIEEAKQGDRNGRKPKIVENSAANSAPRTTHRSPTLSPVPSRSVFGRSG